MPLTLTEAISDAVEVTDVVTGLLTFGRAFANSVAVTDALAGHLTFGSSIANPVSVTDILAANLTFGRSIANSVGVADTVTRRLTFPRGPSDAVAITAVVVGRSVLRSSLTDAVGLSAFATGYKTTHSRGFAETFGVVDSLARKIALVGTLTDSVGVVDRLRLKPTARPVDSVGITNAVAVTGMFVQMDTWRPVPKPDNTMVLVCRTPESLHDSTAGLARMTLWALSPEGNWERPCIASPQDNGYGWTSYSHPEWSPSGNQVVIAVETASAWKIVMLDSSGFGF